MGKVFSVWQMLFSNPRRFALKLRHELLAPTTWFGVRLRRAYVLFSYRKLNVSARNDNRFLFVYDSLLNPITFDFLHYMYSANSDRKRLKKKYLDILLVIRREIKGKHEDIYLDAVGADNISWRIDNLILPLIRLFPSVGRVHIVDASEAFEIVKSYEYMHPEGYSLTTPIAAVCRLDRPELVFQPDLTVSRTAIKIVDYYFPTKDERQIVTITLRSYNYISCRNSDIPSWVKFAKELDPRKYRVIFIPDASVDGVETLTELQPFEVFDSACWNLELRAALYQRAWMNMGVACGPLAISGLLANVWTVMIDRSLDYPEEYYKNVYSTGVVAGQTPGFYSKSCRMILGKDDQITLSKIFAEYVGKVP